MCDKPILNWLLPDSNDNHTEIARAITKLKATISHQEDLVEDFKTHHSILQNSLTYYAHLSEEINQVAADDKSPAVSPQVLGRLSTLILEYARSARHDTALKVFPIIDSLNHNPSMEVNTLINHSLMIIGRLPEIDTILNTFNTLNAEQQILNIKDKLHATLSEHEDNARIFNSLLFICSLYLAAYVVLLFISLQRNKNTLANANTKLNTEVAERANTERTLYSFVEGTSRT